MPWCKMIDLDRKSANNGDHISCNLIDHVIARFWNKHPVVKDDLNVNKQCRSTILLHSCQLIIKREFSDGHPSVMPLVNMAGKHSKVYCPIKSQ